MKRRYIAASILAVAALMTLVACGGGDDGEVSGIRTQKGLSVAAISEGLAASTEESDQAAGGAPADTIDQSGVAPGLRTTGLDSPVVQDSTRYAGAPLLQQGNDGITVQGYGSATAAADAAIIEFYFSGNGVSTRSGGAEPGSTGGTEIGPSAPEQQEVAQITEADLQPVIGAIVASGVPRDAIQFISQSYFDKYYSSATLRATVSNVGSVDAVVQAANAAAGGLAGIILNGANVAYTVNDCAALEEAAMRAAVEDANERAAVFARALGVGLGSTTGASNYSYFGGTPCDPGFYPGPYPLAEFAYAQGQPREVQVIANISVTYAMQ
jgi:uncharacterized protein YggE